MKLPVLSTLCLVASTSLLLAQVPATPATPSTPTTPTTTGTAADKSKALSSTDKAYLKKVLEGIYFETTLTEKAKREAKTEDVKKLCEKMNSDLNKIWGELAGPLSDANEKLPTELAGGDKSKAQRLSKAGDKYEKELLDILSKESKQLERSFESGSKTSQNATIKQVTGNWLPTVKGHSDELDKVSKVVAKAK